MRIVELRHVQFCDATFVVQQHHVFYWDVPHYVFCSALTCGQLSFDMCIFEL